MSTSGSWLWTLAKAWEMLEKSLAERLSMTPPRPADPPRPPWGSGGVLGLPPPRRGGLLDLLDRLSPLPPLLGLCGVRPRLPRGGERERRLLDGLRLSYLPRDPLGLWLEPPAAAFLPLGGDRDILGSPLGGEGDLLCAYGALSSGNCLGGDSNLSPGESGLGGALGSLSGVFPVLLHLTGDSLVAAMAAVEGEGVR